MIMLVRLEVFRFHFAQVVDFFNHHRFKARTRVRSSIIRDLLFADDAALVAASLEEAQEAVDRFSNACNAFGHQLDLNFIITINIRIDLAFRH